MCRRNWRRRTQPASDADGKCAKEIAMESRSHEVPSQEWTPFLDQFSRLHHGQRADVITVGPQTGLCQQARELPLLGVTAEERAGDGVRIDVVASDPSGGHV